MKPLSFQRNSYWIIPLLFLLFTAPVAFDFVFHYPNEKYYTNTSLQMIDKDDYFTPYKTDETPRFLKPIVTYWVIIASYEILGVSPFSSRVMFWLAGALLVVVTFLMTKSITRNEKTAGTVALITAANPLVFISSSRSIPDILLVLFLTISIWGFIEIMIQDNPSKKWYWLAYLGSALAFETKGIPAILFAGTTLLFLIFNPWKRKKISQLVELFSLITAFIIAIGWFAVMFIKHGPDYFFSFYDDQVGSRISSRFTLIIKNGILGIVNLFIFTIPWIIIAFSKPKSLKKYFVRLENRDKAVSGMILTLIILVIIMSAAVFKFYDRYILPVIPLFSYLLFHIFLHSETGMKLFFKLLFLVFNLLIIALGIFYAIFIFPDKVLISGIIISILITLIWILGFFKTIPKENMIAFEILFLFFNVSLILYPLLMPNPGKQLVTKLINEGISENDNVYVYGNIRTASNIRIQSGNKLKVISMDTIYSLPTGQNHYLILNSKDLDKMNLTQYNVVEGSEEWLRVPPLKFHGRLRTNVLRIKDKGTKYFIAKPKSTP